MYDQSPGIRTVPDSHNQGTAYDVNLVGNNVRKATRFLNENVGIRRVFSDETDDILYVPQEPRHAESASDIVAFCKKMTGDSAVDEANGILCMVRGRLRKEPLPHLVADFSATMLANPAIGTNSKLVGLRTADVGFTYCWFDALGSPT